MDQEIDLREYMAVLLKHKYWIIGLAVVTAVVAAVVSILLAPTYEAAALVAVTRPQYEMQFDTRIRPVSGNVQPPYKAYPVLATSDEVLSAVIADMGDELPAGERNITAFRARAATESSGDQSMIRLVVKDGDPGRASAIANRWAEQFVRAANDLYAQNSSELDFFEEQQAQAQTELDQAEQALIDLQARNRAAFLNIQLSQAHEALSGNLQLAHTLDTTIEDARALRAHLQAQQSSAPASPSDEVAVLLIEIAALGSSSDVEVHLPADQDLGDKTVGDQVAAVDSLIVALEDRLAQAQTRAQELEPEILALQGAHQEAQTELDRLSHAQRLAYEAFQTLARKAAEARIAAQDTTGDARLASRAAPPTRPVAPRKVLYTAVAGAVGLLVGIAAALAIEFWRKGSSG
jgi:uncharacterized protein involved in exopolysaccharide biosynthesis